MRAGTKVTAALAASAIALVAAVPAGASGGDATAASAKRDTCFQEARRDLGADYVYSLKTRNLSCEKGEKLVSKFHACRHANGGANGKCNSVKGYSCKQRKLDSSPQLLQAKATCKKGSKKFKQTFGELR